MKVHACTGAHMKWNTITNQSVRSNVQPKRRKSRFWRNSIAFLGGAMRGRGGVVSEQPEEDLHYRVRTPLGSVRFLRSVRICTRPSKISPNPEARDDVW
jgi:hypothetical protein